MSLIRTLSWCSGYFLYCNLDFFYQCHIYICFYFFYFYEVRSQSSKVGRYWNFKFGIGIDIVVAIYLGIGTVFDIRSGQCSTTDKGRGMCYPVCGMVHIK